MRKQTIYSYAADSLALVSAVATSFSIHVIGELLIGEMILVAFLPFLILLRGKRLLRSYLKTIAALIGFWLFSQVVTDAYRGTEMLDRIRADALILFFSLDLLALIILLGRNPRRQILFLSGFGLGSILATRIQPTLYALDYPWKFGYSEGVMILVVLICCYFYKRRRYVVVGLLLVTLMGINLIENYRSPVLFLLVLIALILPVIPEELGNLRLLPKRKSPLRVAILAAIALGAAGGASALVTMATSVGLIGQEAQTKNEEQAEAGGLLIGGRPEIQVSSQAVWDSPILGHGAGVTESKYGQMLIDIQAQRSRRNLHFHGYIGTIPTHSHLMGAWVQAGVLGAVFWIYVMWLAIKAVVHVAINRPSLAPIYEWLLLIFLWDIMFSPFAFTRRVTESLVLVIIIDLLEPVGKVRTRVSILTSRKWRRQLVNSRPPGSQAVYG